MKNLQDIILEKLKLNKGLLKAQGMEEYTFDLETNDNLTINLPFKFELPELSAYVTIDKITQTTDEFNTRVWAFYTLDDNNDEWRVVTLNEMGAMNIFVRDRKTSPLVGYYGEKNIKYLGKRTTLILDKPYEVIIEK